MPGTRTCRARRPARGSSPERHLLLQETKCLRIRAPVAALALHEPPVRVIRVPIPGKQRDSRRPWHEVADEDEERDGRQGRRRPRPAPERAGRSRRSTRRAPPRTRRNACVAGRTGTERRRGRGRAARRRPQPALHVTRCRERPRPQPGPRPRRSSRTNARPYAECIGDSRKSCGSRGPLDRYRSRPLPRPRRIPRAPSSDQTTIIGAARRAKAPSSARTPPAARRRPLAQAITGAHEHEGEHRRPDPERTRNRPCPSPADTSRRSAAEPPQHVEGPDDRPVATLRKCGRKPSVELARLDSVDHVPVGARSEPARACDRDAQPSAARLACRREHGEYRNGKERRHLRSKCGGECEGEQPELDPRGRAGDEVCGAHEECGDDEVVECRRGLQDDDRERRIQRRSERGCPAIEPEPPRDPEDPHRRDRDGEELRERDVAIPSAQDHRGRGLDLRVGRMSVDRLVRRVRDVGDGVLLLPEGSPRKVIDERVDHRLRHRQRHDQDVGVHEHDQGKDHDEDPVGEERADGHTQVGQERAGVDGPHMTTRRRRSRARRRSLRGALRA